mmetsp:Transcript_23732/g.50799  ORF Transcript_23732/g.50799 Transcript_23732/m.50799 type:complete len:85 (-) Transcript_23732:626-880(-)
MTDMMLAEHKPVHCVQQTQREGGITIKDTIMERYCQRRKSNVNIKTPRVNYSLSSSAASNGMPSNRASHPAYTAHSLLSSSSHE